MCMLLHSWQLRRRLRHDPAARDGEIDPVEDRQGPGVARGELEPKVAEADRARPLRRRHEAGPSSGRRTGAVAG